MPHSDVVVIGAGVIGASIAFHLSRAGYAVTVLDKQSPGSGASGSCDQAIFLQSKRPGIHMRLALLSRTRFDSLAEELEMPLEFSANGGMVAIENEQQWDFMEGFVRQQREAGIQIDLLNRSEIEHVQPLLADSILGATHCPLDAEVNPLLLNAAFLAAAQRAGARVRRDVEVNAIVEEGDAVRGVVTQRGVFAADVIINAAGPHAGLVGELARVPTPVVPRRGTILITEPLPQQIHGVLLSAQYVAAKHFSSAAGQDAPFGVGLSLGQTSSGNLLIGGSREFVGFSRQVPGTVPTEIARHAGKIVPSLRSHRVIRMMSGFRPYTGDGLPIIEMSRPGWITAAGHEGDGVALAPLTGQLVLDLLAGSGPTQHFLESLSSARPSLKQVEPRIGHHRDDSTRARRGVPAEITVRAPK